MHFTRSILFFCRRPPLDRPIFGPEFCETNGLPSRARGGGGWEPGIWPNLAQIGQHWPTVANFAQFCPTLPNLARISPNLATISEVYPTLPMFCQNLPNLGNIGQRWANLRSFGQLWPMMANSGELWTMLGKIGRICPTLTNLGQFGPKLASLLSSRVEFGHIRPRTTKFSRTWPNSVHREGPHAPLVASALGLQRLCVVARFGL